MSIQDLEKIFQDKIDNEIKIEPKDWMPDAMTILPFGERPLRSSSFSLRMVCVLVSMLVLLACTGPETFGRGGRKDTAAGRGT